MRHPLVLACLALLAAGCAPMETRPIAAPPTPTVASTAYDNLHAVAWSQRSIGHDMVFRTIYRAAERQLLAALGDPNRDALPGAERQGSPVGLPPAVILDIDETVLDNSPYQARLIRDGEQFDPASWAAWVREREARPLPGALEFTRFAAAHGVTVFYISNRDADQAEATLANLRAAGFPVVGDTAFLGKGIQVENCLSEGSSKSCRRQLVARNYRVLLMIGDQIGDFMEISPNTPQARREALAPYRDWFGTRWFMLPNPTYGSWLPALFGNDHSLPAARKRQQIVEAMRYQ